MDDDKALARETAPPEYCCPGQPHPIDRAVHVARMAAFWPACLRCPRREDARGLSPLQVRDWAQIERRAPAGPCLGPEGIEGAAAGDIDAGVVRRVAAGLAAGLWHTRDPAAGPPAVLVGSDGSWTRADLVAAASGAFEAAGCRALEAGAVTSPCLAFAAHQARADAALWVGNASGEAHASRIKLWHDAATPSSSPGALAGALTDDNAPLVRPKRRGGRLERFDAEGAYLPTLADAFHGLRPLALVLDTTCHALARYWQKLAAQSACRLVRPRSSLPGSGPADGPRTVWARRRESLARQVVVEGAHFGMWIDGDGETCQLVDERGAWVDGGTFFLALCRHACQARPGVGIVLEPAAPSELHGALERLGARVIRGESTRQGMCERMKSAGAWLGGGTSGRYWYFGPPAMSDALWSLSMLVSLLSQSDRPLSEVLDEARGPG